MTPRNRLRLARLILWLDKPFAPITLWAARTVVEDRLARMDADEPGWRG